MQSHFLDALPERHRFLIIHGGVRRRRRRSSSGVKSTPSGGLRRNLCLFYLITRSSVYVQPITLSRLSQTDDVSNWKAWKTLEQRPASRRNQPYFYLPRLAPKWGGGGQGGRSGEAKKKNVLEPVFLEKEQRSFLRWVQGSFLLVSWLSVSHSLSSTAQG